MSNPPLSSKVSGIEPRWGNRVTVNEQGDIEFRPVVESVVLWGSSETPTGVTSYPQQSWWSGSSEDIFPF